MKSPHFSHLFVVDVNILSVEVSPFYKIDILLKLLDSLTFFIFSESFEDRSLRIFVVTNVKDHGFLLVTWTKDISIVIFGRYQEEIIKLVTFSIVSKSINV